MAKKKKSKLKREAPEPPQLGLIPIDREPILAEWRERYRKLQAELDELNEKTEEHQFQALPAFQAWVARLFGEELSAIRELEEKIRENELIVLATIEEARSADCPEWEAFQIVLLRKERGEDLFPPASDWDEGWAEVDPEEDYLGDEESLDRERPTPDPDEISRDFFRERRSPVERAEEVNLSVRLKAIYRKLAFALHPDANPNQTERERKIWDEVQIAYSERDLARLEMLHAWIEAGSENRFDHLTHLGTLRALVMEKLSEVRATHIAFNRIRKEDSWKFWKARESELKLEELRLKLEEDVLHDFLVLRRRLREFELQFHHWRGNSGGGPRRRRRK